MAEIVRIRRDPLVQPHQYRLTRYDTVDRLTEHLFGDTKPGLDVMKSTTVLSDDRVIGNICHSHGGVYEKYCYCGWNLAPPYWGRGIMSLALSQFFGSLFSEQGIAAVFSDCFSNNRRCIRLMQKLNYDPIGIGMDERLQIAITARCYHWIRRFMLTSEVWHAR